MSIRRVLCGITFSAICLALFPTSQAASEVNEVEAKGGQSRLAAYGVGDWPAELGNHRAVVRVGEKAEVVRAHVTWRRRDLRPEQKNIRVFEAKSGEEVGNVLPLQVNSESGDILFQADGAPGDYFIYYLAYGTEDGGGIGSAQYEAPRQPVDSAWLRRSRLGSQRQTGVPSSGFPKAELVELQARGEFNRLDPMEIPITATESSAFLAKHAGRPYLLFPEDRANPIRMLDTIPVRWLERGPCSEFLGRASRNEFYVFQLGVYASDRDLESLRLTFGELQSEPGTIRAEAFNCFNFGGVDWIGRRFDKTVDVKKGRVQPLWIGVDMPRFIAPGRYEGSMVFSAKGVEPTTVRIVLDVDAETVEDRGDSELWKHSRLRWLDSTIALDDEVVTPFAPIRVDGRKVSCLGREVRLANSGLPKSIVSRFSGSVDNADAEERDVLDGPVTFVVETTDGPVAWSGGRPRFTSKTAGAVEWESACTSDELALRCRGRMEQDGCVDYTLRLEAIDDVNLRDIRLEIPFKADVARYMMGMNRRGGLRPAEWNWKWDAKRHQDSVWLGDVNAGVQCKLMGTDYERPLVNIYYHYKPLRLPDCWHNGGRGGCSIREAGDGAVLMTAYSGERRLAKGESLDFVFRLLITPFKKLDKGHWTQRYYHRVDPPSEIAATGANVVNIHHANFINRFINYPFLDVDKLAAFSAEAHEHGLKAKIYYTVREQTNHTAELWALRSLGDEILIDGPGGGYSWLQEHLVSGYARAWEAQVEGGEVCAAVITNGMSRWHNYYLEGLKWMLDNSEIDGIYIDDVAYDREVMKRVRKILDRNRPGSLIDVHSWNHFNERAGYAVCANLYLENFPYVDSLWFGEGHDYDAKPDHWLVELSGIPFGLFGEMLQDGGNPWRGMLFGMTTRLPYSGDPRPIWELWDSFGIAQARMTGYWDPECPVRTGRDDVPATVYAREGETLVAMASWAAEPTTVRLDIDWNKLGLDPAKAKLRAPAIRDFQDETVFQPGGEVPVEPGRGWLILISSD